jgi:hypothetical protein
MPLGNVLGDLGGVLQERRVGLDQIPDLFVYSRPASTTVDHEDKTAKSESFEKDIVVGE